MKRTRSRAERGFTLAELMVSLVAGLFVAMAVFSLARQGSRFSMRQSRLANATLQSVVGFERLHADIARAGFLGTPNIVRDPRVCGRPEVTWPAWLQRLASVWVETDGAPSPEASRNGLSPQTLVLSGSYSSSDEFEIRLITRDAGDSPRVFLQLNSLGMANLGYPANPTTKTLERVFAQGRILRITDGAGRLHFGVIAGVVAGSTPRVLLEQQPALTFMATSARGCGIRGNGTGARASVVNIVRYRLADLSDDENFAAMFRGGPVYEATRRELIREELDADGDVMSDSLELIAEYGVDLGFSLLVEPQAQNALTRVVAGGAPDISAYAGNPATEAAQPQRIRAVHAWLSIRSREADRPTSLGLATPGPGPRLLRVGVSRDVADPTPTVYARMRTLQNTIPLHNQATPFW